MRVNNSTGLLAKGLSILSFSHGRRNSCKPGGTPVNSKIPHSSYSFFFMPTDSYEQLLCRAASWFGIDDGFWDIFGNHHITSVAARQSILRALGLAVDSAED